MEHLDFAIMIIGVAWAVAWAYVNRDIYEDEQG